MRRLVIVLFAVAMAACTTVEHRDYGYYGAGGGDYYHGYAYDSPWYDPYDSLFWGLRYSYYDPFFYPHFYYGVTYFPRYYGWNVGWSSWYAWRYWHPYSPYYGSYWDHYYDWWRYQRPQRRDDGLDQRLAGRRAGMPAASGGPVRFGSARNAAERLAWQRQAAGGSVMPIRQRAAASADAAPLTSPQRDLSRDRVVAPEQRGLPSRTYVPRERIRVGSQERDPREDVFGSRGRAWRGGEAGGSVRGDDGVFRTPAVPARSVGDRGLPSRSAAPAPSRSTSPIAPSRTESRSAPAAPRTQSSTPSSRPSRSESRPSTSRDRSTRER